MKVCGRVLLGCSFHDSERHFGTEKLDFWIPLAPSWDADGIKDRPNGANKNSTTVIGIMHLCAVASTMPPAAVLNGFVTDVGRIVGGF